jgi:hypothetical protein
MSRSLWSLPARAVAGVGWLYDALGRCIGEEWFAQNVPLRYGDDCYVAHIPSRVVLAATGADSAHLAGPMTAPSQSSRLLETRPVKNDANTHSGRPPRESAGIVRITSYGSDPTERIEHRHSTQHREDVGVGSDGTAAGAAAKTSSASSWLPFGVTAVAALVVAVTLRKR